MNFLTKTKLAFLAVSLFMASGHAETVPTVTVSCGDVITQSVNIGNDLNCPTLTGYALKISGDNITVNGGGHKIVAPKATAAIFAQGFNLKIKNFISTGNATGMALEAHNVPKVQISGNDFSNNKTGILIYADKAFVDGVVIENNKIISSIEFGVRLIYADSGMISNPKITGNDLRNTANTAIYVQASEFEVAGSDNNNFYGSVQAYYLKDGSFFIHDADFSQQLIFKRVFFIDSAKYVSVINVNVSSRATNICTEERIGIDMYRAIKFYVKGLVSTSGDVGLVLETEKGSANKAGISTEGEIVDSIFTNHIRSGIAIVSYDSTQYGTITVDTTGFCEPRKDIYIHHGTKGKFVHMVQPTICPDNINYSCKPDVPVDGLFSPIRK